MLGGAGRGRQVAGVAVIILGYLHLGEGNQIGLTRPPIRLRTAGIYRHSRNPIYVGFHLMTLAAILQTLNPAVLLLGMVSFAITPSFWLKKPI